MIARPTVPTTEMRFWAKVDMSGKCWLWTGAKRSKGYGAFVYASNGHVVQGRAHRYSYELHKGPIPPGFSVLHNCPDGDNPACVNPAHLWLGTTADNNRDTMTKGRHVKGGTYQRNNYKRGVGHHNARLTPDIVREIRAKYANGETSFSKLASAYKLAIAHVYRIVRRRAWASVE